MDSEAAPGQSAEEAANQARVERERDFHDGRFGSGQRGAAKYYAIAGSTRGTYTRRVHEAARPGSTVLEFGCGTGGLVFELAEMGHLATAIDISPVAVEAAATHASELGLRDIKFAEMNAEALEFADGSFDLVFGSGILHHLDLNRALAEVARVLRPAGRAVFMEPLGANPVINLYRRFTPEMRTPDEHPLLESDMGAIEAWFEDIDLSFFQLTTLAAAPFAKLALAVPVADRLEGLDQRLFRRFPALRWHAWNVVLDLGSPRPTRSA